MKNKGKRSVAVFQGKKNMLEVLKKLLSKHMENRNKDAGK